VLSLLKNRGDSIPLVLGVLGLVSRCSMPGLLPVPLTPT
jgi:hypothetical protein